MIVARPPTPPPLILRPRSFLGRSLFLRFFVAAAAVVVLAAEIVHTASRSTELILGRGGLKHGLNHGVGHAQLAHSLVVQVQGGSVCPLER